MASAAVVRSDNRALFGSLRKAPCALGNIGRCGRSPLKSTPLKLSNPGTRGTDAGRMSLRWAKRNIPKYLIKAALTEHVGRSLVAMCLESRRLLTPSPPQSLNALTCQPSWRSSIQWWRFLSIAVGFPDSTAGRGQIVSVETQHGGLLTEQGQFPEQIREMGSIFQMASFRQIL